mgnify:FL=1
MSFLFLFSFFFECSLARKLSPLVKPLPRKLEKILTGVHETIKKNTVELIDAFVDLAFDFVDQPLLPSQVHASILFFPGHKSDMHPGTLNLGTIST